MPPGEINLAIAVLLQVAASALAFDLFRVAGWRIAWGIVAGAMLLIASRHLITLYRAGIDGSIMLDPSTEMIGLVASGVMLVILACVTGLFRRRRESVAGLKRLGTIVENGPEEIYTFNADTLRLVFMNRAARQNLGYGQDEVVGLMAPHICPDIGGTGFAELLRPLLAGAEEVVELETRHRRKDGSRYDVMTRLGVSRSEKPALVTAIADDLTVRHQVQKSLAESEETFRSLAEGSLQGILVTRNGKPIFANRAYLQMYGFDSAEELLALDTAISLIAPEDRQRVESYRQARLAGHESPSEYEFTGLTKNGEEIFVYTAVRVVNWFGEPAIQNTNIDITNLKRVQWEMERHRDEAETASRAKSEFMARMSHELRTPLNAIIGFSDVLMNADRIGIRQDRLATYAHDIHSSARHLLDLINDILDVTTMEAGKRLLTPETFDFVAIVSDCLTMVGNVAAAKRVSLAGVLPPGLPALHADKRAVQQILINLLTNAIKFTSEGGKVSVSARCGGGTFHFCVTDDGVGIPAADVDRLLKPFERGWSNPYTSEDGAGLGLSIVNGLVKAHGGVLMIRRQFDRETVVTVSLPVAVAEAPDNQAPRRPAVSA